LKIGKGDYQETIEFTEDIPNTNWKLLLEEEERKKAGAKRKKK
jgi:ATP-dependent RNA helicase RhlE